MSLKLCKTIGLVIYLIWRVSFFFFSNGFYDHPLLHSPHVLHEDNRSRSCLEMKSLLLGIIFFGEWTNRWTPGITNSLSSAQLFLPSDILQYSYSFQLFQWPSLLFTKLFIIFFFSLWWIFSKYSERKLMLPDFHPAFWSWKTFNF